MNKKYKINLHGKEVEIEQLSNGKFKKPEFIVKQKGCHSGITALKQTTEIWNIYRKPFKHGTVTKDIIAYEDDDDTITPSGLNIEKGRVGTENIIIKGGGRLKPEYGFNNNNLTEINEERTGRYPAQLFLDGSISYKREDIDLDNTDFLEFLGIDPDCIKYMSEEKALDYVCSHLDKFNVAELLDEQSGKLRSTDNFNQGIKASSIYGNDVKEKDSRTVHATNYDHGCSRILHNSLFILTELYQHIYYSKPSNYERNAGCDYIEEKKYSHDGRDKHIENAYQRNDSISSNNHPTLKSLKLLWNIIQLFNTVDTEKMKVLIPFSGVFSEKIAFLAHGYKDENLTTIEISDNYSIIGQAREKFWIENNFFFKDEKEVQPKIKENIKNNKNKKKWF